MDPNQKVPRRTALKGMAVAVGAAALLVSSTGMVAAQGEYEGVTLRVLNQAGVGYEPALAQYAEEFSAATGATIEFDATPWESLLTKAQANVAAGGGQYDIMIGDVEFQYTLFPSLLPIQDLIAESGYSLDGLFAPALEYGEGIGGQEGVRYGLPVTSEVAPIFYRTDLIPEFPTTWEGYEQVLADLQDGGMEAPLAFAGVPAQLVKLFLARYWSTGDPLLSPEWEPLVNSENGLAAMNALIRHKAFASPGVLAWDNPEASQAFLNGDAAVLEGWGSFVLPGLNDPDVSKIGDNWAIAPYPEGGTGNFVQHNGIIFDASQNAQAAFDYLAYVTGRESALTSMQKFTVNSAREELWSDPAVTGDDPWRPGYAAVINNGKPITPGLPQWLDIFIGVMENASAAMAGTATPEEAVAQMAAKWEASIAQAVPTYPYTE